MPGYLASRRVMPLASRDTRSRLEAASYDGPIYESASQQGFDFEWRHDQDLNDAAMAFLRDCAEEGMGMDEAMDSLARYIGEVTRTRFYIHQRNDGGLMRSVRTTIPFDPRKAALQYQFDYMRMRSDSVVKKPKDGPRMMTGREPFILYMVARNGQNIPVDGFDSRSEATSYGMGMVSDHRSEGMYPNMRDLFILDTRTGAYHFVLGKPGMFEGRR